jgi:hypothetical protein
MGAYLADVLPRLRATRTQSVGGTCSCSLSGVSSRLRGAASLTAKPCRRSTNEVSMTLSFELPQATGQRAAVELVVLTEGLQTQAVAEVLFDETA